MDIAFAIKRLKQVIGPRSIGTSHTSDLSDVAIGEDSPNYVNASYTRDEALAIVQGLITQALAEQSRRDRVIADIRSEMEQE